MDELCPTPPSAPAGAESPSSSGADRSVPEGAVLGARALNRSLLARQLLLRRERRSVSDTLTHLVAMQAQVPLAPYYSLWARLDGFAPDHLAALIEDRRAVRLSLLRATVHLVTADDCLALAPVIQPVLTRTLHVNSPFGRRTAGVDHEALLSAARALLDASPLTKSELGRLLHERWPEYDAEALAYAVQLQTPLVQGPPRGLWGRGGQARHATAEGWLGRPVGTEAAPDRLVRRYLAAYGPATVADVRAWSGLGGLRDAVERLRPELRRYRDERGRELLDLPSTPLPDPETPAPVRFLGDYDNLLLAHADRIRVIPEEHRDVVVPNIGRPAVIVDGFVRGWWRLDRGRGAATLRITFFAPLSDDDRVGVIDEGRRLLAFAAPGVPDAAVEVVLA
ncbi:MAG TPA: winged helix DNA-binding domain-containing protein [Thermomicrobiaceae bacterium]|nr:winged helix DNA-binding domain-containing protein [Thermomicrobiaceae bacterium]